MATTSKIKEIISVKEWDGQYGKMYSYSLHMENWEYPKLNKTKKDAFKIGDEITYEEVEPWKKWKEVKQSNWWYKAKQSDQRGYFTSIAFQIAFQFYKWEDTYQECSTLARRIFADMMDNYENKQPEEEKVEEAKTPTEVLKEKAKTEDNDLPF